MTAKIRLTATEQEINNWIAFFNFLGRTNVINLLEVSNNYSNRGNSQYQLVYIEAELLITEDIENGNQKNLGTADFTED
ncbi:MAG: hypothetical protein VKK42_07790 [Lyngbya sp.]|nr:hypothetical protein [Lyngbya sp.]